MYCEQTIEVHSALDLEDVKNVLWMVKLPQDFDLKRTSRLEVWCSSFSDPGTDFTEFRFFDYKGVQFHTQRQNGY